MEVTASEDGKHADHLSKLKQQNKDLKEELNTANADAAKANFDKQLAYRKRQDRFRTVFEYSRFGNKIISSDLKITAS